ncbi:hypothetical protein PWR63_12505 [Paraburkholderia sp. A2WS-5]|uniref:hypothetical protein n=1 Tax=unclassified Paraburkholderia TaxID=2615204 RepID=UPI003B7BAFD2
MESQHLLKSAKRCEQGPPGKASRQGETTLDAYVGDFGATDALKYGATMGATSVAFLFQKEVAMQENPVGSTILPAA